MQALPLKAKPGKVEPHWRVARRFLLGVFLSHFLVLLCCFRIGLIRVSVNLGCSVARFGPGALSVPAPGFLYLNKTMSPSWRVDLQAGLC